MNWNQALRSFGLLGLIGGVSMLVSFVVMITIEDQFVSGLFMLIGFILALLGLISFYYVQMNKLGTIGFFLLILAFIGTALLLGVSWSNTFIFPVLEEHAPKLIEGEPPSPANVGFSLSFILFTLGWFLFALWSLIKKGLPIIPLTLILIAAIADWVPMGFFVSIPLWSLGLIWLGYLIWNNKILPE